MRKREGGVRVCSPGGGEGGWVLSAPVAERAETRVGGKRDPIMTWLDQQI